MTDQSGPRHTPDPTVTSAPDAQRGPSPRSSRAPDRGFRLTVAAWITFVFTAYYFIHAPFGRDTGRRWVELGADVTAAAALVAGAAGVGLLVLRLLRLPNIRWGAELALSLLLGCWLLSLWWLVVGVLGGLTFSVALGSTAAASIFAAPTLRDWWARKPRSASDFTAGDAKRAAAIAPELGHPVSKRTRRLLTFFVTSTIGISLLAALAPPATFDSLFYHLFLPQQWIVSGRLTTWQVFPHAYFPHLLETLFVPGMLLGSDITASLLHWVFLPILLWLLWDLTSRFLPSASPLLTVALALATPVLPLLASTPYTDVALATTSVAAVWAVLNWTRGPDLRWIAVAGVLAGMAMGLKYTSFVLPLSIVLLVVWQQRGEHRATLRTLLVFTVVAAVSASPWYLHTFWQTGNPVYPFVFGGPQWDAGRAAYYAGAGTGMGTDLTEWIQLPLWVTLGIDDANGWDSDIGPLYLALMPFLVSAWRRRGHISPGQLQAIGVLTFVAAVQIATWTVGVAISAHLRQNRFLLTPLILLTPCVSVAIAQFVATRRGDRHGHRVFRASVGLVLAATLIAQVVHYARLQPELWLLGLESREQYYARTLQSYAAAMTATGSLPAGAKIFFLWEPRAYLSRRPSHPDAILDEFAYRLRVHGSPEAVADWWRREGYTHFLVGWRNRRLSLDRQEQLADRQHGDAVASRPDQGASAAAECLISTQADEVWASAGREYVIYALRPMARISSRSEPSCERSIAPPSRDVVLEMGGTARR